MKNKKFSIEDKERNKKIKVIVQIVILLFIGVIIIKNVFFLKKYKPYEELDVNISENEDTGFIAISYLGVDRKGNKTLVSTEELRKQIKALNDNGYVTITQQDIIDYYQNKKTLPKKALFLMLEDGRRDTVIYAGKILEKYNYISTILTYAEKFNLRDPKFLTAKDIINFEKTTFFELGTNGYRLKYINVYDKEKNYLGVMESNEFIEKKDQIYKEYNHYLMDYIRDEEGYPLESYNQLKSRIDFDYEKLVEEYKRNIDKVPILYTLMHSNTGQFGTNKNSSKINEEWIRSIFDINFNREGYSLNTKDSSIYDLTRLQPQAYWKTNHLLMRIYDDTKEDVEFINGSSKKSLEFELVKGAAEFEGESIYLTSLPKEEGLIKLKKEINSDDFKITTQLKGNIIGNQSIYLKSDEERNNCIKISYENDNIILLNIVNSEEKVLVKKFIGDKEIIDINEKREINLEIELNKTDIKVKIDGEELIREKLEYDFKGKNIFLSSKWGEDGYSQINIHDDVYDGIFDKLIIFDTETSEYYIDMRLENVNKIIYEGKRKINNIINWFIDTL